MTTRILEQDLTPAQMLILESTRTRHCDEDDTQEVMIDCTYTMCFLSELESEYEADDPEVVELIGANAVRPGW
jgi:hypothetical protein